MVTLLLAVVVLDAAVDQHHLGRAVGGTCCCLDVAV